MVRFIGHILYYTADILNQGVCRMVQIKYVRGHVEVYSPEGKFLFSADSMREVNEILEE